MTQPHFDAEQAKAGMSKIEWVRRSMPILASIAQRLKSSGAINAKRIGVALVLEPKTANLVLSLRDSGAVVSVWAPADCTQMEIVHALRSEGIQVFADAQATADEDLSLARNFLATTPDILVDDGASVIRLAHKECPELIESMIGAAEETTSGVRPLRIMQDENELKIPVIAVNDSALKYLFDNVYGTGQSCVMALLDVTNLQIAGRQVLVIGYGWVGKGVAFHARAMGAQVSVAEIDPVKALQAFHDGHKVHSILDAAATVEVVFAATGIAGALTPEHLQAMPNKVILCTAGGGEFEMPMDYLRGLAPPEEIRSEVEEYTLPNGKKVLLIAQGHCINCTAGEGNPIEVMDLSLSLQASAIERLADTSNPLPVGVHEISTDIENSIALERLKNSGASVEPITPALAAALQSW